MRSLGAGERGSAPADFVLVGSLATVLALGIVQLALILHMRNCLVDAAASAARYGSLADRSRDQARDRAEELVTSSVGSSYASDISVLDAKIGGVDAVEVRIRAPLPIIGLLGPAGTIEVAGHAPAL
ncbi:TadE family protein [Sinomonas sp. JGH33]|uniref:TadE family protein n=1 Tax=Sinomonas terricola TaxID=3110330 RepID=A0ABU5TA98_9MICC|nr:TadE family protein [Sinomonas sp. JGH33]MEA5456036.1 TadE family protein [Sinomonas sp. JGH33]